MKKAFLVITLLLFSLTFCSCASIQASMAKTIDQLYGVEGSSKEEYEAYYQREWDAFFDSFKELSDLLQQEGNVNSTETTQEQSTDIGSPNQTASVTIYKDANGYEVPVFENFPNAKGRVELTEYPIDSYFPSSRTPITIDGKQYDLGSSQCLAYARYIQQKLYDANEYSNSDAFAIVPNSTGIGIDQLDADTCRNLITEAGPGAHIRTGSGIIDGEKKSQHSMIITSVDENGFEVIDSNGTKTKYKNDKRYYTWEEYCRSYGRRGFASIKKYVP